MTDYPKQPVENAEAYLAALRALAVRVRESEAPSRELDRQIGRLLNRVNEKVGQQNPQKELPRWTGSLDAAMTLFPQVKGQNNASLMVGALHQIRPGMLSDHRIALAVTAYALEKIATVLEFGKYRAGLSISHSDY